MATAAMNAIVVLNSNVEDGLIPDERIAFIQDVFGKTEEVSVSEKDTKGNKLLAFEVGRQNGRVLVELPRESASGRWRLWVKESEVAGG